MGCVESREEKKLSERKPNKVPMIKKIKRMSTRTEEGSGNYSFSEMSGRLPEELSEQIPFLTSELEPEISSLFLRLTQLEVENWTFEHSTDQVETFSISSPAPLLKVSLNFNKRIPTEVLLKFINIPEIRSIWDLHLLKLELIEGKELLDCTCKLYYPEKEIETTRYIRFHDNAIKILYYSPPEFTFIQYFKISQDESSTYLTAISTPSPSNLDQIPSVFEWGTTILSEVNRSTIN